MKVHWLKFLLGGILGMTGASGVGQFLPALAVEPLDISDSQAYGKLIVQINAAMKEKYEVPLFLRAYESTATTGRGKKAFSLSPAGSFEGLMQNQVRFQEDADMADFRDRLEALSESSGRVFLKAVRFDGTNTPGWLLNTLVKAEDEAALLDEVSGELERLGLEGGKAPMVNVFRVMAGESAFTHLVSMNFESRSALGAGMDAMVISGWDLRRSPSGEPVCEWVEGLVFREL